MKYMCMCAKNCFSIVILRNQKIKCEKLLI